MRFDEVLGGILPYCWEMLNFEMPGLGITCKTWVVVVIIVNCAIFTLRASFDLGGSGSGYRSGQSNRKYISEKRKGDTH